MSAKVEIICLYLVISCGLLLASGLFENGTGPQPLIAAHQAYLNGDCGELAVNIRKQLMTRTTDDISNENALALWDHASKDCGKSNEGVNGKLPSELSFLQINSRRTDKDGKVTYALSVMGDGSFKAIEQLQLIRFPNRVLIDKRAGVFEKLSDFGVRRQGLDVRFYYQSKGESRPVEDGLYFLTAEYDGGKRIERWFILSHSAPETSPQINIVGENESALSGSPTFLVTDFWRSPSQEHGEAHFCLSSITPQENQMTRWNWKVPQAEMKRKQLEVTVGKVGYFSSDIELDHGPYTFALDCFDVGRGGDLKVARQRTAIRFFQVRKP
jgi:hypothetical protein